MASTTTAEGALQRARRLDRILAPLLLAVLGAVFFLSPVRHLSDPRFAMLLGEEILLDGSFDLSPYFKANDPSFHDLVMRNGLPRHVRRHGEHVFYIYPYGSSLLSVPFLAVLRLFGYSATDAGGHYSDEGEMAEQAVLASFLAALTGLLFYAVARQMLAPGWSVALALGAALASPLWSTASRAVWSHTWGLVLLTLTLLVLLREARRSSEAGGPPPRWHHPLLATLLAWAFFVRPTAAVYVVPVAVYVIWRGRRRSLAFLATGFLWLAAFLVHSRLVFGQTLPDYYLRGGTLGLDFYGTALRANLVSPARGLLVYCPWVLLALYLVIRHWPRLAHRSLAVTALSIFTLHLLVVSTNPSWWAGNCYGPRMMTETIPLWVLLAAVGWRAALEHRAAREDRSRLRHAMLPAVAALLFVTGGVLNGAGALSYGWVEWHSLPDDISWDPQRVFDWREAPFLWAFDPQRAVERRLAAERERWQTEPDMPEESGAPDGPL